jgi:adenosyl cobinamide kinase/adenosyl cobinamide phosphate guanylyltransferase
MLFASHDLISPKYQGEGHILISCLRAYLNLFMFTGFHLHTMETIESGREELKRFNELMKVRYYIVANYTLIIS